jgi:type II secretory pathway pseudopilin PulG
MASSQSIRTGIQVVLAIVILVLAYVLYESITDPYEQIQRRQELTEMTRQRMSDIRTALIRFEQQNDSFPDSLDVLVDYLRQDSALMANQDSVFGHSVNLDSLLYSPRTGKLFQYAVNDTGRVETYLLQDPDSDDQIGTLSGDVTQTNAATWE